jgi:hypothetical protein
MSFPVDRSSIHPLTRSSVSGMASQMANSSSIFARAAGQSSAAEEPLPVSPPMWTGLVRLSESSADMILVEPNKQWPQVLLLV